MKKIIAMTLAAAMLILTACGGNTDKNSGKTLKSSSAPMSTVSSGSDAAAALPSSTSENKTNQDYDTDGTAMPTSAAPESGTSAQTAAPDVTEGSSATASAGIETNAVAANPTSTAKPSATQGSSGSTTATAKPTTTAKPTATAKATTTAKPTATAKPTTAATPTPTVQAVTYSFYPSSVTVYAGDDTPVYLKIKDSNGKNVSASELELYWYDYDGNGNLNFNRNTAQKNGTYSVSDANVARLAAMIYADGTEEISVNGYWGKIGTCTISVKHKASGQMITLTVTSIKDEQYAAYYHPYNWEVIDADMKAFVESKNGVYDTTMTPENSGYFPGIDIGGYVCQGKELYESFINGFIATEMSFIESNPHETNTIDNWNGARHYLWRKLTSGTAGADDECYLVRDLYG